MTPASAGTRSSLPRRVMFRLLSGIRDERIDLWEGGRRFTFGRHDASLRAVVHVHDPGVYRQVLRGSIGLSESYMDGEWDTDDLVALIRIGARNMPRLDAARRRWHPVLHTGQRLARMVPHNDPEGSRRNISAHYDLGNQLFSLFLDPTMMYSCAVFENAETSLEQAQLAKLERVCKQLRLGPDDHLLEIGTGWGSMAVHAASRYGCRVTTTTISREQHDLALERVRAAGLEHLVTVLLEDYRDLSGTYSKLVSIEMIEAVGWQFFDTYFRRCSELLEPDGLMFLQAITIDDRAYEVEKASKSFINTHVFPGGCLPSLEVIHRCIAGETDMRTVWLDDITEHYGETLARWRAAFVAESERAEELGYDLRFRRTWELYLAYVEAGFRECRIGDVQMVMAKPEWRGSLPAGDVGLSGPVRAPSPIGLRAPRRIPVEHARRDPVEQERRPAARELREGGLAAGT
jgi:cyclopropane-fatty-acyl-phospholipid synthase